MDQHMILISIWKNYSSSSKCTGFRPHRSDNCPQNVEDIIMPRKTIVVVSACWYRVMPQSQCSAGPSTERMVISMESAIQHKPTHNDSFTWNQPNPRAFTACVTVYVSKTFARKIWQMQLKRIKISTKITNKYKTNGYTPSGTTLTEDISKFWQTVRSSTCVLRCECELLAWIWLWRWLWWMCFDGIGTLAPGISS